MSDIWVVKVSDKGQISIPLELRELMGISKGDTLIMYIKDKSIIVQKAEDAIKKIKT